MQFFKLLYLAIVTLGVSTQAFVSDSAIDSGDNAWIFISIAMVFLMINTYIVFPNANDAKRQTNAA